MELTPNHDHSSILIATLLLFRWADRFRSIAGSPAYCAQSGDRPTYSRTDGASRNPRSLPGIGLVYFANSSSGLSITREVLEACLGGTYPAVDWLNYRSADYPSARLAKALMQDGPRPEVLYPLRSDVGVLSLVFRHGAALESLADTLCRLHFPPCAVPNSRRIKSTNHFVPGMAPYLAPRGNFQDTARIDEGEMNRLGYLLLSRGYLREAETVLAMNTRAYPGSANVHDSYGEALLRNGKPARALEAYRRALELDSSNRRAAQLIQRLDPAIRPARGTEFSLAAYPHARHVALVGDFNDWDELTLPLRWENGRWIVRTEVPADAYRYAFVVDGITLPDPENPDTSVARGRIVSRREER